MNPLSSIFGVGVRARNFLYDRGVLPQRSLQGPVVSVGNLSVGGAGKTPFVILLGELLKARGIKFDILSRGYRRENQAISLVDENGSPRDFGDEPLLLTRRLQVPVIVGADRHQAGLFAEKLFGPQLHLLDDGFQHRRLHRDFDIVIVTQEDLGGSLLPMGRLREPPRSLSRADAVALINDAQSIKISTATKQVWRVQRGLRIANAPSRPIVFCGIARPKGFVQQLRAANIEPAGQRFFRDHHAYTSNDIRNLLSLRDQHRADGFITTEKDAVNLHKHADALQLVTIARVTMQLEESDNTLDTMLRIIAARRQKA
ncbi:MAG: tetraacyldisaccharide 4'-kinase [Acidobacteriaceae bacterium]